MTAASENGSGVTGGYWPEVFPATLSNGQSAELNSPGIETNPKNSSLIKISSENQSANECNSLVIEYNVENIMSESDDDANLNDVVSRILQNKQYGDCDKMKKRRLRLTSE